MTLTEAENIQSLIGDMSVEEFSDWLEGQRQEAHAEGYRDGYAEGAEYD